MKAFKNTIVSKPELISVLEAHALADNFTKGKYWKEGKGCAVGCSLQHFTKRHSDHTEYEKLFGIPRVIARLEDSIFEGLSNEDSKWWPLAFAQAIPEGADLSMVWPKFAVWLLGDKDHGVIRHAEYKSKKTISDIVDLYTKKIAKEVVTYEEWRAARSAADRAAAAADAYAGAADAAAYAAAADADAAAYAAADAYAAGAGAAAAGAAYSHAYAKNLSRKKQADKLIEILKEYSDEMIRVISP